MLCSIILTEVANTKKYNGNLRKKFSFIRKIVEIIWNSSLFEEALCVGFITEYREFLSVLEGFVVLKFLFV